MDFSITASNALLSTNALPASYGLLSSNAHHTHCEVDFLKCRGYVYILCQV